MNTSSSTPGGQHDPAPLPAAPELLSRAKLDGTPRSAQVTRAIAGSTMLIGATAFPWLGPSLAPGPGITYLWEIPGALIVALGCSIVVLVAALRPDASPSSPHDPPVPRNKLVVLAALTALGVVVGSAVTAELLSLVSIGRTALESLDGEQIRLLPGPGQGLFMVAAVAALLSGSGQPPWLKTRSWVNKGRLGSVRGWLVILGVLLIWLSRVDVWVEAASYSVTGAEIPLLGQVLGVLVSVLTGAAVWTMARGGLLPRAVGGLAGISLAVLAAATLLAGSFVSGLVPDGSIERRVSAFVDQDVVNQAVESASDELVNAGAGSGPLLALAGVALLTVGASFRSRRGRGERKKRRQQPDAVVAIPPPPRTSSS